MFDSLFPKEWTTLQRLMWLKTNALARAVYETITGNPVTFTAKKAPLRQLSVAFSPKQDLHGYDSPWPAGGGKNKFDGSFLQGYYAFANGSFSAVNTWITTNKIPCKPSTYYTVSADAKMTRYQGFCFWDSNGDFISSSADNVEKNIGQTAQSPSNASFLSFNIAGYPSLQDVIRPADVTHLQIEEGQTATSYSPYSNICPISGWDSLNVSVTGINIYDENDTEQGRINLNTGADNPAGNGIRSKTIKPIKPNTTYRAIRGSAAGALAICYYDQAGTFLSYAVLNGGNFTTPATAFGFRLNLQTVDQIANPHDISINYPATDTSYHAYNPSSRSISITFPAMGKNKLNPALVDEGEDYKTYYSSYWYTDTITLLPNTAYIISPTSTDQLDTTKYWVLYVNRTSDPDTIEGGQTAFFYPATAGKPKAIGFTTGETGVIRFGINGNEISKDTASLAEFMSVNWQIELGSAPTAYEPYTNTVYSGYVDVVTGAGEVTMASVDLGSFNWKAGNRNNEDTGRVFYVTGLPVGSTNSLCSIYKQGTQSWEDMHVNNYYLSATGAFMVCADYANKTDFATAVTGQTLCYELATPIPLQLTPQEVQSLLGVNNMWSDANGDLTVEYRSN